MTLAVQEFGAHNARTVVLVHGGGAAGWMWSAQREALGGFHVLVPDLPEHGESRAEGPFSIARSAERLAAVIEQSAHDGRASVVGLSLGGQVALQLVSVTQGQIERLLVSGALVRPLFGASAAAWMARAYWPFKDAAWLVRTNMRALGIPDEWFELFAAETRATTLDAFLRISAENVGFRVPKNLGQSRVPATVVVGEREPSVMLASARDLAAAMPTARAFRVKGAGHNWPMQSAALFNAAMLAWLEDQPLPDALVPIDP